MDAALAWPGAQYHVPLELAGVHRLVETQREVHVVRIHGLELARLEGQGAGPEQELRLTVEVATRGELELRRCG